MKVVFFSVLLAIGLVSGASRLQISESEYDQINPVQTARSFSSGHEYTFNYDSQISTGLNTKNLEQQTPESAQRAVSRIQALVKITFQSPTQAILLLKNVRIGTLNKHIEQTEEIQPFGLFELKRVHEEKQEQLELPCLFQYQNGLVKQVQFDSKDQAWSKNIKRSVLNMIQVDLEGKQQSSDESSEEYQRDDQKDQRTRSYRVQEETIEGNCQSFYTINRNDKKSSVEFEQRQEMENLKYDNTINVTKSINFKQCQKIADVANGFQTVQDLSDCQQCYQRQYLKLAESDRMTQKQWKLEEEKQNYCQKWCDAKEVKEQHLDRSTVLRMTLAVEQQERTDKFAIQRSELVSQYVYKSLNLQTGPFSSQLQAIVLARLVFARSQKAKESELEKVDQIKSSPKSTLLYDNEWDVKEKRFYMEGDEEFGQNGPFSKVSNKVELAKKIMRKLITEVTDKATGIEYEHLHSLQQLVEVLRMCSMKELNEIRENIFTVNNQISVQESERKKAKQMFADCLAISGTRNTLSLLAEQIVNKELSVTEAFQALKSIGNMVAPSDKQAKILMDLCQSEQVQRNGPLKQACWLGFGGVVNELCAKEQTNLESSEDRPNHIQYQRSKVAFGAQSGFVPTLRSCPTEKKEQYKQALIEQLNRAESTYEKVLALKALGNAGIDTSIYKLEQIIQDNSEERVVRSAAIDALRRQRTQMPRKIQRVLLPVFQNTKEQTLVRIAAFGMIMSTQPEQDILDQLVYTLIKERNSEVQSYVYTAIKTLAKSGVSANKYAAKHLENLLKLVEIDEETLQSTRHYQVPIYSNEHQEGAILNFGAVFNDRDMLPTQVHVSAETILQGMYLPGQLQVSAFQKNVEQWYEQLVKSLVQLTSGRKHQQTRASRKNTGEKIMDAIRSRLNIQLRGSKDSSKNSRSEQDKDAYAMICLRVKDVDQAILPLEEQFAPTLIKKVIKGERPRLSELITESWQQGKQFRLFTALNMNERSAKVPTSVGLPLRIQQSTPLLVQIEGGLKINLEDNLVAKLNVYPTASIAHIQKIECWMPITITGSQIVQAFEFSAPIDVELSAVSDGIQILKKTPEQKNVHLLGLHSLPTTYIAEWDERTQMQREPKVRSIHQQQFEHLQQEVDQTFGDRACGMPLRINGHYHWPRHAQLTSQDRYSQIVQLWMATENHVHVTFEPKEWTPKQVQVRVAVTAFQPIQDSTNVPELDNFYTTSGAKFSYSQDISRDENELHSENGRKLNKFLTKFQPKMYQHTLKLSVETKQGRQQCKAELKTHAVCDASFKFCKTVVEAQRTPLKDDESSDWKLTSKIQMLRPDAVSNVEQLQESEERNQMFILKANTEWGTDSKQNINIKIQGQNVYTRDQRDQIQSYQGEQRKYQQKRAAFINRFDLVAEYKLKHQIQNYAGRVMDWIKSQNFWNTESQMQSTSTEGQLHASLVIDPLTQREANISVKTPQQFVRIQSIPLSYSLRPFSLVRQQDKRTHSVNSFLRQIVYSDRNYAECSVDGRRVQTFDNTVYQAPLGKCFSVVAKDCQNSQSNFAVLMKALSQDAQNKRIRILTPDYKIECESNQQRLQCRLNGQIVPGPRDSDYDEDSSVIERNEMGQQVVEWRSQEQTDVIINPTQGVSIRFACNCKDCRCQKAWIRLSQQYRNSQCGLCGHYDDESENELRMSDNQLTEDLAEFHRSYSIQDSEECTEQEHQKLYSNADKFKKLSLKTHMQSKYSVVSEEEQDEQSFKKEQEDREYRAGHYAHDEDESSSEEQTRRYYSSNSRAQQIRREQEQRRASRRQSGNKHQTIEKTKVVEFNHKVCFSVRPVKHCPEGTVDASDESSAQEKKKMQYVCMSRGSTEARRMQRKVRQGEIVDVVDRTPSFVESIQEPTRCVVVY